MFDISRIGRDVLSVKLSGTLGKDDYARVCDAVESSLAENEKTHICAEIEDFTGVDVGAFAAYLPRGLAMLRKLDRFGRIAVVSDQRWIRWATRLESALLPHISYETFESAERDRALAWVKGESELPHGPALKLIETGDPNVLAYEVNGKITAYEMEAAASAFEPAIAGGGKLRVLGRVRRFGGVETSALLSQQYLRIKRELLGRVERYALVGAPLWMESLADTTAPLFGVEFRCFRVEEEPLAWAWLGAAPKEERPLVA